MTKFLEYFFYIVGREYSEYVYILPMSFIRSIAILGTQCMTEVKRTRRKDLYKP